MSVTVRPYHPNDGERCHALRMQAFTSSAAPYDPDAPYLPQDRRLVAESDGRVVGHLGVWDHRQWFGGNPVACGGVAGVAVAPEARGQGVASALLARSIEDMADRGDVVSALFPMARSLYRRWGWELAGRWIRRRAPLALFERLPAPATETTVRRAEDGDLSAMHRCYEAWAATHHGMLARSEAFTRRSIDAPGDTDENYVVVRDGAVTGYALIERMEPRTGEHSAHMHLEVHELIGLTTDDELALWQLVAGHATTVASVTFASGPVEPLEAWARQGEIVEDTASQPWMLRIVDVPGALQARGYPAAQARTISLQVTDPAVESNTGRWTVEVSDGQVQVAAGGDGRVSLDITTLAALYSGYRSATDLARWGLLTGASADDIDALEALFHSPTPWLLNYF